MTKSGGLAMTKSGGPRDDGVGRPRDDGEAGGLRESRPVRNFRAPHASVFGMVSDMNVLRRLVPSLLLVLSASAEAGLRYAATLSERGERLDVAVCAERGLPGGSLRGGEGAFLLSVSGDGDSAPRRRGDRIDFGAVAAGHCLRYAVDVRAAGLADRYRLGWNQGRYAMVSLSSWLWRPTRIPDGSELTLSLPAGWSASLPFSPLDDSGRRYRLSHTPIGWSGSSAFGRFEERHLALPGGRLRVSVLPVAGSDHDQSLHEWVRANAGAMLTGSGRMPLPDAQVLVVPLPGVASPTPWGQVLRGGGSALRLFAGLDASQGTRMADWTLSHELAHLFHPYLGGRGRWLGEGLASYFQNVLRARADMLSAEQAWRKLDSGFERGRRERGGHGRALTEVSAGYRGTMRVYWSGAAYWLEADLALRERHGTSLDAVLAAFARRHLPASERWEPERFVAELAHGNAVPGSDADLFVPLYRRYAGSTEFPDLRETYRRLGLGENVARLRLTDTAPAAAVREARG